MTGVSDSVENSLSTGPLSYQNELLRLIGSLADVMFCIKSPAGHYLEVNDAFVRRAGTRSMREVIGATAKDLFPPELAQRYEAQDRAIFASGKPLRDELEVIRRPDDKLGWYLTTKLPIRDEQTTDIVALASISRDLRTPTAEHVAMESLQEVVHHVQTHLQESIRTTDLAEVAGCTTQQLDRQIRRVFGLTPMQYVLRVRVERGVNLLRETDLPITDISVLCGFYDQPDFTRKFARLTSYTPAQFRSAHHST